MKKTMVLKPGESRVEASIGGRTLFSIVLASEGGEYSLTVYSGVGDDTHCLDSVEEIVDDPTPFLTLEITEG